MTCALLPDGDAQSYLTVLKDSLYFRANDGKKGQELWKSDGTKTGTELVKDINPDAYVQYQSGNGSPVRTCRTAVAYSPRPLSGLDGPDALSLAARSVR